MRKFLAFLFLTFGFSTFAQEGFKIGVQVAPTYNFWRFENQGDVSKQRGFGVKSGLLFSYGFSPKLSLVFQPAYVLRSVKNQNNDVLTDFSFVEIPVGVKFRFLEFNESNSLSFIVAPSLDILFNVKQRNSPLENNGSLGELYHKLSMGLKLALPIEKSFDFGVIGLMPEYHMSLTNLFDQDSQKNRLVPIYTDAIARLSYISLNFYYYF